jgi:hypothetical protein
MKIAINSRMTKNNGDCRHMQIVIIRALFDEVIIRYIKGEYA